MSLKIKEKPVFAGMILWIVGTSIIYWFDSNGWFLLAPVAGLVLVEGASVKQREYRNDIIPMVRYVAFFMAIGAIVRQVGGLSVFIEFLLESFKSTEIYLLSCVAVLSHYYLVAFCEVRKP